MTGRTHRLDALDDQAASSGHVATYLSFMNRGLCRWAALIGIGTLLFATLSVAAYACPMAAGVGASMAMPVGCPDRGADQSNLCKAHCTAEQQQTAQAAADLPPLPLMHGLLATLFVAAPTSPFASHGAAGSPPTRTTSPPSTIRNCCFRL